MEMSCQLEVLAALLSKALSSVGKEKGWPQDTIWTLWKRENYLLQWL